MKFIIGFWGNDERRYKGDRMISYDELPIYVDKKYTVILDREVHSLEDGEYIFQIKNTIRGKNGKDIHFVTPYKEIVKCPRLDISHYLYGEMHKFFKRAFMIYENPDFETAYDLERMNYAMRVLRSLGFDWVPKDHSDSGRSEFYHLIHDKILSGDLDMYKLYTDTVKEVDLPGRIRGKETPFDRRLQFDPEYDELIPVIVPDRKRYTVDLCSKDIGLRMMYVSISNPEEYEKYKEYIHPDVDIRFETDGIVMGYKIPAKDSPEYKEMIQEARISEFYCGLESSHIQCHVLVPSTVDPSDKNILGVNFKFYPEILHDVMEHFHLRVEKYPSGNMLLCDEDYEICDFRITKSFSAKPTDYIDVKFKNGIRGYFKAIDVIKKLKGKCTNATYTKFGDTLENLTIFFKKKKR